MCLDRTSVMPNDGLNLGQISFSSSYTRHKSAQRRPKNHPAGGDAAPVRTGPPNAVVGPMFQLVAGQIDRPLQSRSTVPTTLVSSVAHAATIAGVFLLISMSERVVLPTPHETTYLVALLAAVSMATESCTLWATENCTLWGESCRAAGTFSR